MDRTRSRGPMWGVLALVLAIGLVGSALTGGSALAAKGGGGGHNGGGTTPSGTCWVAPNPVAQWAPDTINGSGFAPNTSVGYFITGSGGTAMGFATTDGSGSFSTGSQGVWLGTNTVTVGTASCTFQVV